MLFKEKEKNAPLNLAKQLADLTHSHSLEAKSLVAYQVMPVSSIITRPPPPLPQIHADMKANIHAGNLLPDGRAHLD